MMRVANTRMYNVAPAAALAWTALLEHVAHTSGVALEIVEHPFPAPVSDLWKRPDLALAFMCGWPWIRGGGHHLPVAVPIPIAAGYPVYWSDLVVRADNPARSVADLEGGRIGYTLLDSQSGFSAMRHYFRTLPTAPRFSEIVGPITTPRRVLEAVGEGRVDIAPVDSFAHGLLRRHEPALAAGVRVLVRTEPTPIPLLVASPGAGPEMVARLRAALLAIDDPALLEPLTIQGFTDPLPRDAYMVMETRAREAEADGVHDLLPFTLGRAA